MGYNGYYEFLVQPGTISSNGSQILTYITGSPSGADNQIYNPTGNSSFDSAKASVSGLDVFGHFVGLYGGQSNVTNTACNLAKALGTVENSDFIFSVGAPPTCKLSTIDPSGLPTGTSLALFSSSPNFTLDQVPKLSSRKDFFFIDLLASGASLSQSAPINIGRVSILGPTANVNLPNTSNRISVFAAKVANLSLYDSVRMDIGKVDNIFGVTTSLSGKLTLNSGDAIVEDSASQVTTGLLNITAVTGIDLCAAGNDIVSIGQNHTDSGPDCVSQH